MAVRITKKDGQVVMGRVVNADDNQLELMVVGNHLVKIARGDISKTDDVKTSLMYENLLNGMSDMEKESLMDFLMSLSN